MLTYVTAVFIILLTVAIVVIVTLQCRHRRLRRTMTGYCDRCMRNYDTRLNIVLRAPVASSFGVWSSVCSISGQISWLIG